MNRIEELMNEFNLKQKDFLDKVGITRIVMSNLMLGKTDLKADHIRKIM